MNVIFIHGMNQQQQTAASLQQNWLDILEQGLIQAHQQAIFPYLKKHVHMPFYGDLLTRYHLENTLNASTLMPQVWSHLPFFHPTHPLKQTKIINNNENIKKSIFYSKIFDALKFSPTLKTFSAQSKDLVLHDFSVVLNYFPKLHANLLHKFLVETYLYLSNPHFIHAVHTRIHEQLHNHKTSVIVAHSLGSVIAYHFLLLHPELKIHRFISLGSPLAFRVIQTYLPQPLQHPVAISGDWINFYSHDDFLSSFPLIKPTFDFQPAIINHQIRTDIYHPHDIQNYLQHPKVIQALLDTIKNPA